MPPQFIAGDVRGKDPTQLKDVLESLGIKRLDTAAIYDGGESEKRIGAAHLPEHFTIDTKIMVTNMNPNGSHTPELIEKSLSNSLKVMGVDKVNVYYCHTPDLQTPVVDQAKALDEQYRKGRFTHLGFCNFSPSMIQEWLDVAEKHGYVKPTVYQGQYNLLCRGYETTNIPLLRKHNMVINAFSPLAGGFLLGHLTEDGLQAGSRFNAGASGAGSAYLNFYDHPSMHEAIKRLRSISKSSGIGLDELSLRWLVYHSALGDQDGVILGGSKLQHFENNMAQIRKGPLDDAVVQQLDALWDVCKEDGVKLVQHDDYLMGKPRP